MPKKHELKELRLKLTGSPHYVKFDDETYSLDIRPEGVYVDDNNGVEYFYPVVNIVECKIITTLFDDKGNKGDH